MMLVKVSLLFSITLSFRLVDCFATKLSELDICKNKICIPKCCGLDKYVHGRDSKCAYTDLKDALNFSKVPVYKDDLTTVVTTLTDPRFHMVGNVFEDDEFKSLAYDLSRTRIYNFFLSETGVLYLEKSNFYLRWTPRNTSRYCVDYRKVKSKNASVAWEAQYRFFTVMDPVTQPETQTLYRTALMISSLFLLIVLLVYAILPELRNLGGLILMAYVGSLLCAFFLLSIILLDVNYKTNTCIGSTMVIYYSLIASFCWMNIMSYDIWWTFRGYAKARSIHRRGEIFKFQMYCLYGFGVPLVLTILLAVMHFVDFSDQPWIIKPQLVRYGCFMGGPEKMLYLYVPMLILIMCNWMFFLMTAFNVWRLSRGTAVLDSAAAGNPHAHRTQRHRFMVYLKLSIVMGINWVLEVVSSQLPELQIFKVSDLYNVMVGLFIFLIFVFKKKILRKLMKKLPNKKRWAPASKSYESDSSTSDGSSQETSLPLVCSIPKGPIEKST